MSQDTNYAIQVKEDLKDKLEEYIFYHNIDRKASTFRCPNAEAHNNGDNKFSASYNKQVWNCFSCQAKGDIFHFAGYLEGLPYQTKEELYGITIPHIADELKIDLDLEKYEEAMLTMNFKNIAQVRRMREKNKKELEQIKDTIQIKKNWKKLNGEFNRHYPDKLKEEITDTFDVFFPDTGDFNFLEKKNIFNDKAVIKTKNLVFPIYDKYNNLVYFCARRPLLEEPKYCYTLRPDNNDHPPSLFNVFKAKKYINIAKRVFLFEAQFDCMVAFCSGLKESLSIGTNTPIDILLQVLSEMNIKEIILILDPDKAGVKSTVKYYKALSEEGYVINCIELPEGKDADEVIVEQGINYFKDIANQKTVIEYAVLKDYEDIGNLNLSLTTRYLEAIQFIVSLSKSAAIATTYAETLKMKFDFKEIKDVQIDLSTAYATKKNPLTSKMNKIIEGETQEIILEHDIEKKVKKLYDLNTNITGLFTKYNASYSEESIKTLRKLENEYDDAGSNIIRTHIKSLDEAIRLFTGALYVLSAKPSHLKSTLIKFICKNICMNNEVFPAAVIHISTDDNTKDTYRGMVAALSEVDSSSLESKEEIAELSEEKQKRILRAKELIRSWWTNNLYCLYGVEYIKTVEDINRLVVQKRNILGEKIPIIVIIDSFMNIPSISSVEKDKRLAVESGITRIKEIGEDTNVCMLALMEIKRTQNVRITADDLKETGAIEFRAKGILLLHDHYKHDSKTKLVHMDMDTKEALPILEIRMPKIKNGSPNKLVMLKAFPANCQFEELDDEEFEMYKEILDGKGKRKSGDDDEFED